MAERIPQGVAKRVLLKAYLASDHVTPATGKTIPVVISKNGGAFANPAAGATNATEIANGWYYVDLGTGDADTLGGLIVRGTEGTIDDVEKEYEVVDAATFGIGNLDAAISTRAPEAGGNVEAIKTQTDKLAFTTPNKVDARVDAVGATAVSGPNDLKADVSALALEATAGAIKAKTDNLPADPASQGGVEGAITAAAQAIVSSVGSAADAITEDTEDIQARLPDALDDGRIKAVLASAIRLKRNQAFANFHFEMETTGLVVTAQRAIDDGSYAACANSPVEVGLNTYRIDLADSDLNGTVITFAFSAPGVQTRKITVLTEP